MSKDDSGSFASPIPPDDNCLSDKELLALACSPIKADRAAACFSLWRGRHKGGILKALVIRMIDAGLMDEACLRSSQKRKSYVVWEEAVQYIEDQVYCPECIGAALQSYDPDKAPMTFYLHERALRYVIPAWFKLRNTTGYRQAGASIDHAIAAKTEIPTAHLASNKGLAWLRPSIENLTPDRRACFVLRLLMLLEITPGDLEKIALVAARNRLEIKTGPDESELVLERARCVKLIEKLRLECQYGADSVEAVEALNLPRDTRRKRVTAEFWFDKLHFYEREKSHYRELLLAQGVSQSSLDDWEQAAVEKTQKAIKDQRAEDFELKFENISESSSLREKFELACRKVAYARSCYEARSKDQKKNSNNFVINIYDDKGQLQDRPVVRLPKNAEVAEILYTTGQRVMENFSRALDDLRDMHSGP